MRIGQLARHLNISPGEIRDFIRSQGFTVDSDTNTRLDESGIRAVLNHFAPDKIDNTSTFLSEPDEKDSLVASGAPNSESSEMLPDGPVETIRAPKIELQGLKVLGKIDLPEPKKKPEPAEVTMPQDSEVSKPSNFRRREQRPARPWVNPLEKQRRREAREAEEEKKRILSQQKELRAAAYHSRQLKIRSTVPVKSKQEKQNSSSGQRIVKPRPTGFFARIWHWLTNAE